MAPSGPEADLNYVLSALKNTTEFKVNYHALAAETGMSSASKAQVKFKTAVERSGQYKLVAGKVVENMPPATPTTLTTPAISANAATLAADNGDDNDDDDIPPPPQKKRKASSGAPKKTKRE